MKKLTEVTQEISEKVSELITSSDEEYDKSMEDIN